METKSCWHASAALPQFEPLSHDIETDVAIIGGGLTGITAAYLLKKAGVKVVLLERQRCAGADTGCTTAHLTYVTDERLHRLVKIWGRDGAKAFWEAGVAALDQISANVQENRIDCEFEWVPGYLHGKLAGSGAKDRDSLQRDADLARQLGFEADFLETVPYAKRPGVRFASQAKFHPLKYLSGLLNAMAGDDSFVFENSEASEIEPDPLTVRVNGFKVRCRYVIIATHNPLMGKSGTMQATLFQSKLALYTSYVVGARLPRDLLPQGLFWDTNDPYYYLRVDKHADHAYAIFGGLDHKTGQEKDSRQVFEQLERELKKFLPEAQMQHRWLGQVVETNDGLPFIGENENQQFIATGFCGNGFTLGTLSALMARDRFLGRKNPWFDLFAVGRKKFHGGTWRYLRENLDYPYYLLRDRLAPAEGDSPDDLKIGEGKILRIQGQKTAAYRDQTGKVHLLSPVCTHLKCIVRWNAADKTWDCPCHGSRFQATGEVLSGPAEVSLQKISWGELQKAA
jgi:glycine/D-amino acid oxidase-like deaminating enzyme/nitrite reductase/ring-hydroxylating ferredoxin subunit